MDVVRGADSVLVDGVLDVRSVAAVRAALEEALEQARTELAAGDVVLDVTHLEGIDAAGLGVLVSAHRKAQRCGSRLVLRGAQPAFLRTLAVTRLHRVLHVERMLPV